MPEINKKDTTFSKTVIEYLFHLNANAIQLPKTLFNIGILNPLQGENKNKVADITNAFYKKYYSDTNKRRLILGINPGRHGAGLTNIPFTDSKRLESNCKISARGISSHEPSSVFVYDVIAAYGGVKKFYADFLIQSVFPLGFVKNKPDGKAVNFNYYDAMALQKVLEPHILKHLNTLLTFNINTDIVFCLGTGKNYKFLCQFNQKHHLFGKIVPLAHPRYVMQYKYRQKAAYIEEFANLLKGR